MCPGEYDMYGTCDEKLEFSRRVLHTCLDDCPHIYGYVCKMFSFYELDNM